MIHPKDSVEPVPMYKPGKPIEEVLKEYGLTSAIKLASNENAYGYSPKVEAVLKENLHHLYYYPDGQAQSVKDALSAFLGVSDKQLLMGAGLDEVIQMISRAMLDKGSNTVMALPTFPMYKINAMIEGAEVREIPVINGLHNLDRMLEAIDDSTRVVWVCNPNNPTGTYLPEQEIIRFLDTVPSDVLVVLDEAYYEYVQASDYPNSLAFLQQFPNLMILRTFSKAYGLAGLRIGYGIASEEVITAIGKVRKPFNTSSVAQLAAIAALEDQEFVRTSVEKNHEELEFCYQGLEKSGLKFFPSQTNFIYIDVEHPSGKIYEALLPYGVIIRPMAGNFIRVTMGTREQNIQFFEALQKVLDQ